LIFIYTLVDGWEGLFKKFPPGDSKYFITKKTKTRNLLSMISLHENGETLFYVQNYFYC